MSVNQVTVSGQRTGLASGADSIGPATTVNQSGGGARSEVQLVAGNNTIVVPTDATYVAALMVPPATSTNPKTLKGVAGDLGIQMSPAAQLLLPVVGGSFVILSGGAETLEVTWI